MENVGIFYVHLVYFTAIRNILFPFVVIWYILPVLVCCTKKNLATLFRTVSRVSRVLAEIEPHSEPGLPDGLFSNQKSPLG
jgi:hypothetical protein